MTVTKTPTLAERVEAGLKANSEKTAALFAKLEENGKNNAAAMTLITKAVPAQVPRIRRGESALTSRGFQFTRLFAAMGGHATWDDAKVEKGICDSLRDSATKHRQPQTPGYVQVPMGTELMFEEHHDADKLSEYREIVKAGVHGADPDEMAWMVRKAVTGGMSYVDATTGGALVGPPVYGEMIDLLRNKDALMRAGATVVALPPTGITYPRILSATTGYWLGEKEAAAGTTPGTGTLTLQPKKCVVLVKLPNELLRYGTVSAEMVARNDMALTLSLTLDKALIDGNGGGKTPLGLLNTVGVGVVTPTTVAADGNTLSPGDIYSFLATVFGNNADFTGFILRPDLFLQFVKARGGVYNGSTTVAQGQFLFDQMRTLGDNQVGPMAGATATLSNNVPKDRVKGSGTTLTCMLGGNWPDFYIAMLGTAEFATTNEGMQLFEQDMTAIRAILTCDGGARHPGAFAVCDNLLTAVGA